VNSFTDKARAGRYLRLVDEPQHAQKMVTLVPVVSGRIGDSRGRGRVDASSLPVGCGGRSRQGRPDRRSRGRTGAGHPWIDAHPGGPSGRADAEGVRAARVLLRTPASARPGRPRGPRHRRGSDRDPARSRTGWPGGVTGSRGIPGLRRTRFSSARDRGRGGSGGCPGHLWFRGPARGNRRRGPQVLLVLGPTTGAGVRLPGAAGLATGSARGTGQATLVLLVTPDQEERLAFARAFAVLEIAIQPAGSTA
jgi:hypothetical protein